MAALLVDGNGKKDFGKGEDGDHVPENSMSSLTDCQQSSWQG